MKFKTLLMMGLFSLANMSFADSTLQYPSHAPFKGLEFEHHDWQVSCDNIGTCRIAGYHQEEETRRLVSVLFTRTMDSKKPIQGVVQVDLLYDTVFDYILPLEMKINGKSYGQIRKVKDEHLLNTTQIQALIQHANQNAKIEFIAGEYVWQLSDKGMRAVLLKADEYQQRVNTPSAFTKKGNQANPQGRYYIPSITAKSLPRQLNQRSIAFNSKQGQALVKILAQTVDTRAVIDIDSKSSKPHCRDLVDTEAVHSPAFHVIDVSKTQKLVSYQCWSGAYNTGYGVWLMNYDLSQVQQLVTVHASDVPDRQYPDNKIMANHKGLGTGDCWVNETWTWNGQKFIKTYAGSTGMCRGFTGGAWALPTYSVDLDNNKSQRAILSNGS
ncbi:DUF1176 domain-containing protein [Moraxella sp. ZY210820]|uniref:DUF1176 domain-containing protein n=1 Tax=unclassified Moraxella TaxID=2685852 RepID=UPI0027313AC3|nr:DUF1176 domain-containing protein [Moraxella sp. ZY210820]WLF83407.1 DUF1176 domain-containing protein [Moraxella sp. ZY210820]